MTDEDQIGTPLTKRAPPWFVAGCTVLAFVAIGCAVFFLRGCF